MALARAGTPAAVITTTAFEALAHHEAYTLGMEALPFLVIEHPLGGEPPERVAEKAARAVAQLAARLGQ
ncbi:MAG TPA: hypothetical protein VGW35_17545 [Methylomirabilota bacterium]|nr:hypothetical protein [Methylomirabilota bacterium]